MILPAKITTASKSKSPINSPGIVQPNLTFKRKPDIALARSIVQPQRNKIAVRMVNLAPTPVTLYKNSKVGTLHPVKSRKLADDEDVQEYEILEVLDKSECNEVSSERKDDQRDIVKELFEQTDMSDLSDSQSGQLEELLRSYKDIFSSGTHDFGRTNKIAHKINIHSNSPTTTTFAWKSERRSWFNDSNYDWSRRYSTFVQSVGSSYCLGKKEGR